MLVSALNFLSFHMAKVIREETVCFSQCRRSNQQKKQTKKTKLFCRATENALNNKDVSPMFVQLC